MQIQNLGDKLMSDGGLAVPVQPSRTLTIFAIVVLATLHIPNKNGYCHCQTRLRKKAAAYLHRLHYKVILWVSKKYETLEKFTTKELQNVNS
jgi:hypothetical protein